MKTSEITAGYVCGDELRRLYSLNSELVEVLKELLAMCKQQTDFNDISDGCIYERAGDAIAKAEKK